MSSDKSLLLENLKKTLAVGLPVMAISGFVPTALTVDSAQAEAEYKSAVVAEAKSEAEGKYSKAKSEAEGKYAKAEGKAEAEGEAKAEGEAEAEGEAKKY